MKLKSVALTLALTTAVSGAQETTPTARPTTTATPAALVTFYSNSISLQGGFPKQKGAAFKGRLFSDDDQIAFMEQGRFLTVSFIPGQYTFSANAWMVKSPTGGAHLKMDLVAGQHYFVETASRAIPMPTYFSVKKVSCERAFKDNSHDKPLEAKHISASVAPFVVSETSFPTCP